MRRALLLAALAIPALARAQTAGQVTFTPDANIGAAECDPANGETVSVSWQVSALAVTGGKYRIFASSRAPTAGSTTSGFKLCDTGDGSQDGVPFFAGQVGEDITATSAQMSESIATAEFVAVTKFTCQETTARTIHVCVHFFPTDGSAATDSATGELRLDLRAPTKPSITSVTPGEEALRVTWRAGTGGAEATYFKIQAIATDTSLDAGTHTSGKFTGSSGRIEGLKTGVEYQVRVIAFSSADNASEPSDPVPGTPVPVQDFFEHYQASGGQEQGGCASGPAGALGILGAALALALHRRRK